MNRLKRWVAPAMLVIALSALAAPAMASASSYGMEQEGKPLPLKSEITLASSSVTLETSKYGNLSCEPWTLYQTLTENTEGTLEVVKFGKNEILRPTTIGFTTTSNSKQGNAGSGCHVPSGATVAIEALTLHSLVSTQGTTHKTSSEKWHGGATANLTFVQRVGTFVCTFFTSEPMTYVRGASTLEASSMHLEASPKTCGTAALNASFAVSANGKPVILN
jgi:hypothetical protein